MQGNPVTNKEHFMGIIFTINIRSLFIYLYFHNFVELRFIVSELISINSGYPKERKKKVPGWGQMDNLMVRRIKQRSCSFSIPLEKKIYVVI